MPSKWTFTIKPIKELLDRYVGDGKGWIDPFAGKYSPAELTNDINYKMPTGRHLEVKDFAMELHGIYQGILFDPPYSLRQIKECYENLGINLTHDRTLSASFNDIKNIIASKIRKYAISFGWNSNGFGKKRGFKIVEILLVAHGGHHNDTIVTVEQKTAQGVFKF